MIPADKTTRQIFRDYQANPRVSERALGERIALLNIDLQRRYTDTATFSSAYEGDPRQFDTVNQLACAGRGLGMPVVWTYVAYPPSGCARGTIVDAMSHGYRVAAPEETVADREESPHFASLYDIAVKYGDVKPVEDALAALAVRGMK